MDTPPGRGVIAPWRNRTVAKSRRGPRAPTLPRMGPFMIAATFRVRAQGLEHPQPAVITDAGRCPRRERQLMIKEMHVAGLTLTAGPCLLCPACPGREGTTRANDG